MYQEKLQPKGIAPSHLTTFRSILKFHESKQYKKGIKAADTLLKTYPDHGETLALKGLILFSQDKHAEAYELVRKALKSDITSALCWDVMSHLQLEKKNYFEASKCVQNALLHQPENNHLIRELASLHVQNRDFANFQKATYKLLVAKSGSKIHWMSYAVACALNDENIKAVSITDKYRDIQKNSGIISNYEESELFFFKSTCYERSGDLQGALKILEENKAKITDKEEWKSKRAEILGKLGRHEESAEQWLALISANPENWTFHHQYLVQAGVLPADHPSCYKPATLSAEKEAKLLEIYGSFGRKFPFARACRQIPLSFVSGEEFEKRFTAYLSAALTKGTISVFGTIKYLYQDPTKVAIIDKIISNIVSLLEADKPLPNNTDLEPPSSILFAYFFYAQHLNREKKFTEALAYIDKCIQHTPTQVDWYSFKGRIYQAAGNPTEAAVWSEKARSLDLADRFLNTKATKYFLKADKVKEAEDLISIFTKVELDNEKDYNTVTEMQVTWYELEEAESYIRSKDYGRGLRRFFDVKKHVDGFRSDQMDFHQYSVRKLTLRAYLNMIHQMDQIYSHPTYVRAAIGIVQTYLFAHDHPLEVGLVTESALAGLPEDEKKRLIQNKKKEDTRKQKIIDEKKAAFAKKNKKFCDDYFGDKALAAGLEGAVPIVNDLQTFAPKNIISHLLAFEVAFRRGKFLQALRAVNKARALEPENAEVHYATVRLFHAIENATLNASVQKVFEEEKSVLGGNSLAAFNKNFYESHKNSVQARIAYFQSSLVLGTPKEDVVSILKETTDNIGNLKYFIKIDQLLQKEFGESDSWKETVKALFPHSAYFNPKVATEAAPVEEGEKKNWFESFLSDPAL
eukprot:TRINITY_DN16851_c0_g1_i1.p1 TRINITY_DN16851_c0_g1~~TRINITY_DN16851_c0_g1_i1.p1  ORF type:complete len:867 (-),score=274.10 TRINITY_DN16851_c0_g1_i1:22-2601(-)